jgi:hypothetical protein
MLTVGYLYLPNKHNLSFENIEMARKEAIELSSSDKKKPYAIWNNGEVVELVAAGVLFAPVCNSELMMGLKVRV